MKKRGIDIQADGTPPPQPAEISDIKKLRREKLKRKKRKRLFMLSALILLIAAVISWGRPAAIGTLSFGKDLISRFGSNQYPVTLSSGNFIEAAVMGSSLGVLTDSSFYILSPTGKTVEQVAHGVSSPRVAASRSTAVIYSSGGNGYKVVTRLGERHSGTAASPITGVAVCDSAYAVMTESTNYLSELTVYDNSDSVIFKLSSATGRILTASLSTDGKRIAVVETGAKDGKFNSKVSIYRTNQQKPVAVSDFPGTLIYSVSFKSSGTIAAVGDVQTVYLSAGGGKISTFSYQDRTLKCYSNNASATVLVFSKYGVGSDSNVVSLGKTGEKLTSLDVSYNISSVHADSYNIVGLAQKNIWHSSIRGSGAGVLPYSGGVMSLISIGNDAYAFGLQSIYQYKIN
jgi:hypothetical protein